MKLTGWKTTTAASAFAVLLGGTFAACSGDDSTPGTGGSTNTGGSATGGGTGTGGTPGTGGGATGGGTGTGGTVSDSGAEAGCTCTGANCTPAGTLFSFDPGVDGGGATGWAVYVPPGVDAGPELGSTVGTSSAEGHTAAGSLQITVPYTAYGQNPVSIQHNYGDSPGRGALDWSCKTKLHVWVKIAVPDGGSIGFLNGVQAYVQSGNTPDPDAGNFHGYERYTTGSPFLTATVLADGMFHETVIDLTQTGSASTSPNLTDINQIGVQVLLANADAGTGTPGTVTLFVDDVVLE